jgi:cell wall-active antibiotic response 4TMS protein YvqF
MRDREFRSGGRLLLGLILILLGTIFALDEFGIVDADQYLFLWPCLLILYGILQVLGIGMRRRRPLGGVVVIVGTWFLLDTLGFVDLQDFWPVLLVLLGAALVVRGWGRHSGIEPGSPAPAGPSQPPAFGEAAAAGTAPGTGGNSTSTFSAFALLSGIERRNSSADFRGGDATAVLGGCEIDLRGARIQGSHAVVDVFALWGGVSLKVPREWQISGEVTPILGGFEDKTAAPTGAPLGHLIIKGTAIMGGVEVSY